MLDGQRSLAEGLRAFEALYVRIRSSCSGSGERRPFTMPMVIGKEAEISRDDGLGQQSGEAEIAQHDDDHRRYGQDRHRLRRDDPGHQRAVQHRDMDDPDRRAATPMASPRTKPATVADSVTEAW